MNNAVNINDAENFTKHYFLCPWIWICSISVVISRHKIYYFIHDRFIFWKTSLKQCTTCSIRWLLSNMKNNDLIHGRSSARKLVLIILNPEIFQTDNLYLDAEDRIHYKSSLHWSNIRKLSEDQLDIPSFIRCKIKLFLEGSITTSPR